MVAIIDYDAGNIKSVENAVRFLGHEVKVTADAGEILSADHIILPGVGAFGDAMQRLRAADLEGTIRQAVEAGKPFLGICLGLQLIFEESEESPGVKGLALLPGRIKRIPDGGRPGRKLCLFCPLILSGGRRPCGRSSTHRIRCPHRCSRRTRQSFRLPVPSGKERADRYADPAQFPGDLTGD